MTAIGDETPRSSSTATGTAYGRGKSSDEIEREVENTRSNVRQTLDELRDRMSPGQMIDQAVDYFRGSGGGELTRNLGRQIRDNPMPLLLVAAGVAWMMAGPRRGSMMPWGYVGSDAPTRHERWPTPGPVPPTAESRAGGMMSGMRETAGSMAEGVSSAMSSARSAVSSAYETVTKTASDMADRASRMGRRARRMFRESGGRTAPWMEGRETGRGWMGSGRGLMESGRRGMHDMRDQAGRMGSALQRIAEEQPLVMGAVGLAVGAALGAALPRTRMEDEMFGATSDRMKSSVRSLAEEHAERARQMAREAAAHVGERLEEEIGEAAESVRAEAMRRRGGETLGEGGYPRGGTRPLGEAGVQSASGPTEIGEEWRSTTEPSPGMGTRRSS